MIVLHIKGICILVVNCIIKYCDNKHNEKHDELHDLIVNHIHINRYATFYVQDASATYTSVSCLWARACFNDNAE